MEAYSAWMMRQRVLKGDTGLCGKAQRLLQKRNVDGEAGACRFQLECAQEVLERGFGSRLAPFMMAEGYMGVKVLRVARQMGLKHRAGLRIPSEVEECIRNVDGQQTVVGYQRQCSLKRFQSPGVIAALTRAERQSYPSVCRLFLFHRQLGSHVAPYRAEIKGIRGRMLQRRA